MSDPIEALERELEKRETALNESVKKHHLRRDHGEGECQYREVKMLKFALDKARAALASCLDAGMLDPGTVEVCARAAERDAHRQTCDHHDCVEWRNVAARIRRLTSHPGTPAKDEP